MANQIETEFEVVKESFLSKYGSIIHAAIVWIVIIAVLIGGYVIYGKIMDKLNGQQQPTQPSISISTNGEQSKPTDTKVVYIQGQDTVQHEVVYVPKETDPATGQQEKTDVQIDNQGKKIYVRVNGKEYELPSTVTEDTKFENGKLVVTEQATTHVDITQPRPAFNIGLGKSNNGTAVQINGPLYKDVSWWGYGDSRTKAVGLQFTVHK